jgi:hypothetical protein
MAYLVFMTLAIGLPVVIGCIACNVWAKFTGRELPFKW